MNQIERLRDDLTRQFRDIETEIDAPDEAGDPWFLDIRRAGNGAPIIVVEWRPDRGFGVSTPRDDEYGAGPDETYPNARTALDRVVGLIVSGGETSPPVAVRLAELRQARGLSQEQLAERSGVHQASISRLESRDDILISTLRKIVNAMGATLSIRALFPDGSHREISV